MPKRLGVMRRPSGRALLAATDDEDGEASAYDGTPLDATIDQIGMGPYQAKLL